MNNNNNKETERAELHKEAGEAARCDRRSQARPYPGVLYRGGAEQKIRQYLVDNNYIDTVEQFVDSVSTKGKVDQQWQAFVARKRAEELAPPSPGSCRLFRASPGTAGTRSANKPCWTSLSRSSNGISGWLEAAERSP